MNRENRLSRRDVLKGVAAVSLGVATGAYGAQEESAEEVKMPAATDLHSHGVTQDQLESLSEIMLQAIQQGKIRGCSCKASISFPVSASIRATGEGRC